jgi:chromate reductase
MSASIGMLGGARAQYHLRQCFVFLNTRPIHRPEMFVSFAVEKFDERGRLTDDKVKELTQILFDALVDAAKSK